MQKETFEKPLKSLNDLSSKERVRNSFGKCHFNKGTVLSFNQEEVYKLDPQYIKWASKNSQYLTQPQKELMEKLLSQ